MAVQTSEFKVPVAEPFSRVMLKELLAVFAAGSAALLARDARAYTLREVGPDQPVRWRTDLVHVVVDPALAGIGATAVTSVAHAFASWEVEGTETPGVVVREGSIDGLGYRPGASNANTIRFAAAGDPVAGGALAVTVLTFGADGTVLDADIVVNGGGSRSFGVLQDMPADAATAHGKNAKETRYDLQNVLTHEVGHFFGLGEEETNGDATMFVTSSRGEVKKRDLADDDENGLRALYQHEGDQHAGACAFDAPGRSRGQTAWWLPALAGVAWAATRKRRRSGAMLVAGACGALWLATGCSGGAHHADEDARGALAEVIATESRWERGLLVTRVTLRASSCDDDEPCADVDHDIEVLGGTLAGITQIVGHHGVPAVGARVPIALDDGRLVLPETFPLRHGAPADGPSPRDRDVRTGHGDDATLPSRAKADPRRVHDRVRLAVPIVVFAAGAQVSGMTGNVSEGGLLVETDRALALGSHVSVELVLAGATEPTRASAVVRWSSPPAADVPATVGLSFDELSDDDAAAIRALVEAADVA